MDFPIALSIFQFLLACIVTTSGLIAMTKWIRGFLFTDWENR